MSFTFVAHAGNTIVLASSCVVLTVAVVYTHV